MRYITPVGITQELSLPKINIVLYIMYKTNVFETEFYNISSHCLLKTMHVFHHYRNRLSKADVAARLTTQKIDRFRAPHMYCPTLNKNLCINQSSSSLFCLWLSHRILTESEGSVQLTLHKLVQISSFSRNIFLFNKTIHGEPFPR